MFKKLLSMLLVIGLCLLACEAALQVYHRVRFGSFIWQRAGFYVGLVRPVDDARGYIYQPDSNSVKYGGVQTDHYGFRQPGAQDPKEPVILALGDSVPFGATVKGTQSYPVRLRELLGARGCAVGVVNAAISSYNSIQALARYDIEVAPRFTNLRLVLMQTVNDISLLTHFRRRYRPDLTWLQVRGRRPVCPNRLMGLGLCFYTEKVYNRLVPREHEFHQAYDPAAMLAAVSAALEPRLAAWDKSGVPVILLGAVFMDYRQLAQGKTSDLQEGFESFIEAQKKVTPAYNRMLQTMAGRFPHIYYFSYAAQIEGRPEMFNDIVHLSPQGNQRAARALLEFLDSHGLLKRICRQ